MDTKMLLSILNHHGYRVTRQRILILDDITRQPCLQSAEAIYERCRARDSSISMPTVYRTLEVLVELGLMRKLHYDNDRTWFEVVDKEGHHHHMICQRCGHKAPIDECPVKLIEELAVTKDFEVMDHRFEIFGVCSACKNLKEVVR